MTTLRCFTAAVLALAFGAGAALADGVVVAVAWSRASAPTAKAGAAYMTVTVDGTEMDRLVAAATPVAKKAELHGHIMDGGVMKMRPVAAIEVHPGEPAVLQPGGLHVMLMGLKGQLKEGATFPVTLTFERAGDVEVEVHVGKAGAMGPTPAHGHGS